MCLVRSKNKSMKLNLRTSRANDAFKKLRMEILMSRGGVRSLLWTEAAIYLTVKSLKCNIGGNNNIPRRIEKSPRIRK